MRWGKQMVNYLWNLELFYYIVLLFIIVSGFIDWYRMDRLIDNDLKVHYLTAVWSKISIGLLLALYFFIYFRFNIFERITEFMPFYVFVLIISISVYLVSRFIMFAVKSVLTRIYK